MSSQARNFLRLRYWLEARDGGELRSPTDYERTLHFNLVVQAVALIGASL